ncbi:MAG TPA: hypothetical protein VEC57_13975 [Candidatus Limnocylindrales bacterium]|nr:hypothetical protein [Candidatus Limnocylindrales bacterium]
MHRYHPAMAVSRRRWIQRRGIAAGTGIGWPELLAAAFAIALYLPALGFGFVFDDRALIGSDGWPLWLGGSLPYRPVRWASYLLDGSLGGSAAVYHAHNVAWHGLVAACTVAVARALGAGATASVVAAICAAAHPLAVEAAAYVAGRRDLLAVASGLIALLAWLRGAAALAAAALLLAVGAKESALAFVPVLAAASACALAPRSLAAARALSVGIAGGVALAIAYGVIGPFGPNIGIDGYARVGATVLHYAATIAWPAALSPEYPDLRRFRPDVAGGEEVLAAAGATTLLLTVAAITLAACLRAARRSEPRPLLFCAAWITLAAICLSVWGGLHEPGADRHAYLLLPALGVGLALLLTRAQQAASLLPAPASLAPMAAAILAIAALSAATRETMMHWRDESTLWSRAVQVAPASARMRYNLASVLSGRGEYAQAQFELSRALRSEPDYAPAHLARAAVRCARGRSAAARPDLLRALELGAPSDDVAGIARDCTLIEFAGLAAAGLR